MNEAHTQFWAGTEVNFAHGLRFRLAGVKETEGEEEAATANKCELLCHDIQVLEEIEKKKQTSLGVCERLCVRVRVRVSASGCVRVHVSVRVQVCMRVSACVCVIIISS